MNEKLCPVCKKEPALIDPILGILPGPLCTNKRKKNILPNPVEMVGENILKQRDEYGKSIVQPFNSAGEFSAEYYDAYGTKGIKVTPNQIKKRKYIWEKAYSRNYDITKTK